MIVGKCTWVYCILSVANIRSELLVRQRGWGKYSEPERICIQIKDNFVMLCVVCLTACLCLLCRWRWMQTISAIAHAPKVSARMHIHSHTRQRHSGWPSLPQRQLTHTHSHKHTYIVYTHHRTNPSLSHLSCLFSLLPPLLRICFFISSKTRITKSTL